MKTTFAQLLIGLGVLLLLTVLLRQQIITTIFWYKVVGEVHETKAVSITPTQQTFFVPNTDSDTYATYTFYDLSVPLIFTEGAVKEDSSTVLAIVDRRSNKAYSVWRGAKLAHQFLIDPRRTNTEIETVCGSITATSSPCTDNYQFLTSTLSASTRDAGFFSTQETKVRTAMYLLMKQTYIDAETSHIIPITLNDTFVGYLLYAGKTATALIFDEHDRHQPYQIVFSNMHSEEINTVLINTGLASSSNTR